MLNNILTLDNNTVSAIIALLTIALTIAGIILIVKLERKKYKRDKVIYINDEVSVDELNNFLKCRMQKQKRQIYFTLALAGVDDYDQITEFLSNDQRNNYIFRLKHLLKIALPKGGKFTTVNGEEIFLIYLPERYKEENELLDVIEKLKDIMESRIKISDNFYIQKNATIGIVKFPENGKELSELENNLKTAFYSAKKKGGNNSVIFECRKDIPENYIENYENLRDDIFSNKLELKFRPLYFKQGKITGFEAILYRIDQNKKANYNNFIKALEKSDDGFWLLLWWLEHAVIYNINLIKNQKLKDFFIKLPLTEKQMMTDDNVFLFQSALAKYMVSPRSVMLQVRLDIDLIKKNQLYAKKIMELKGVGFKMCFQTDFLDITVIEAVRKAGFEYISLNNDSMQKTDETTLDYLKKAALEKEIKIFIYGQKTTEELFSLFPYAEYVESEFDVEYNKEETERLLIK